MIKRIENNKSGSELRKKKYFENANASPRIDLDIRMARNEGGKTNSPTGTSCNPEVASRTF